MSALSIIIPIISIFLTPFALIVLGTIILASLGKSLGIRQRYVKILLKIFEWGQRRIRRYELETYGLADVSEEDEVFDQPVHLHGDEGIHVIQREIQMSASKGMVIPHVRSLESMNRDFELSDAMDFCKSGIEAIIEDEVTKRFSAAELTSWNLLTRTNEHKFFSLRLTILWWTGFFFRYMFLLPFRFILAFIGICGLIFGTAVVGYIPNGKLKQAMNNYVNLVSFRIIARALSAVVRFHNRERKARGGGICVANHTSPIDVVMLATDNCYAMVGQAQGGFLGIVERALNRATAHVWFERSEVKDRLAVARRLKEHIEDPDKLPILIFPEGTCINNTSVMMFKKGSFEVGGTIYPVAIKYDSKFADVFWNSSKHSMVQHILMLMSSWAIVCDVWYLPPEEKKDDENAIQFANRIKRQIAQQGGLVDLEWDGQLKRMSPKESMKENTRQEYSKLIKSN
ncbi:glycerol-3-phosphate acyltransferase 4-like isoform X2 [Lineus longissimus]|uniref:glycerol-3-phosphate acyltransferase 4-like isoform X2 n=1 Tax=Lineus longissimus TaxID=88925 RepID=UPI00315D7384